MLYTPLWMQAASGEASPPSYSAAVDRSLLDTVFTSAGIVGPGDLQVAAAGSGLAVTVAAGRCVIVSQQPGGKYLCWSDSSATVNLAAAPGAGLSRVDLIVAHANDALVDGGTTSNWILEPVTGTAASSAPSAPAVPAGSLLLATVAVGPNATTPGTISDQRALAGVLGTVRGNPAGKVWSTSVNLASSFAAVGCSSTLTTEFLRGGMTAVPVSQTNLGLIVPVTGIYRVSGGVCVVSASNGGTGASVTAGHSARSNDWMANATASNNSQAIQANFADEVYLTAGTTLTLWGAGGGSLAQTVPGGNHTWLSASLSSQG